ncbi:MAG: CBS domain containing-hemolysin-like protein [Myxococcota bacterium]|jgi:CBS domain containing-hemolysin-like protein
MLGALLGGLRYLLQVAAAKHPTNILDDGIRQRLTAELERRPNLVQTSALVRVILVTIAAVFYVDILQQIDSRTTRAIYAIVIALLSGLLLEGVPSLVQRNRGSHLVLLFLPIARVSDWCMRPLILIIEKLLHALNAEVAHDEDSLSVSEQRMIGRVFSLAESDAAKVMTPRTELTAVHADATLIECLETMNHAGHSRVPVYGENLDDIVGIVYLKDIMPLMIEGHTLSESVASDYLRESYFIPETKSVSDLLEEMRSKRVHLAIAVDEYGGTAGVISIEDILEEIVGEIQDEHDEQEEQAQVVRIDAHTILIEGKMALSDLNELLDCHLPHDEDYDTIAGLLFDRLGHIPMPGEVLQLGPIHMQVQKADERRILQVKVTINNDDD